MNGFSEGIYTLYNEKYKCYLAAEGQTLTLRKNPSKWLLKSHGENRFNVISKENELMLDIDNAYVAEWNTVKAYYETGYDVQLWSIKQNSNGSFSVCYCKDTSFCLGFSYGKALLEIYRNDPSQQWQIKRVEDALFEKPILIESANKTVTLKLPENVLQVCDYKRLREWADNLETAYFSFYELTFYLPFQNILLDATKKSEYFGWVYPGQSTININRDYICDELRKMSLRECDWNFAALHEMGHMFDFGMPWDFETELMTDFKLSYVLEKNNAAASIGNIDEKTVLYGKDIRKGYDTLHSGFESEYNIFAATSRFLRIKESIGWEPFSSTFRHLRLNEEKYKNTPKDKKVELFIELLSLYSGKNVKLYFSPKELQILKKACK